MTKQKYKILKRHNYYYFWFAHTRLAFVRIPHSISPEIQSLYGTYRATGANPLASLLMARRMCEAQLNANTND